LDDALYRAEFYFSVLAVLPAYQEELWKLDGLVFCNRIIRLYRLTGIDVDALGALLPNVIGSRIGGDNAGDLLVSKRIALVY